MAVVNIDRNKLDNFWQQVILPRIIKDYTLAEFVYKFQSEYSVNYLSTLYNMSAIPGIPVVERFAREYKLEFYREDYLLSSNKAHTVTSKVTKYDRLLEIYKFEKNVLVSKKSYSAMNKKDMFGNHTVTESRKETEGETDCVIVWSVS